MTEERANRKLTAIFSADVAGYSRLMADNEEATVRTINVYREVITSSIADNRGRVVDAKGDNVLAEFSSVVDAVRCAVDVQKELSARNTDLPEHRKMAFRIGVNLGDVIEEKETIYGDGVNVAARLEGLADPGGVCISGTAFDHVRDKLELGYEYLGEQSVKNILRPVRTYKVIMAPENAGEVIGEVPPKPKRWRWTAAAIAIFIAIGAYGFWHFYFRPPRIEPASREKMAYPLPDKPSIAVLPFVNMSSDPEQDYFSDGLTEDIITALSKVPELFVIDRSSTFTYKNKPVKIQKVAEDLGVRYVMEGSVQKAENRIRITAQLIDALTGYHVWAERFDRELKDLFAMQDKITLEILKALDIKLARGESLHGRGTSNLEAYFKYLQLRKLIYQFNKESNVKARKFAEEAISLDPDFPAAYYGLAAVTMLDVRFGISKSPENSLKKAIELCQKAVSLDDTLASAYGLLGYLYVQIREYEKGIAEGERAIQRAPNSADAHSMLAQVLNFSGRPQEAIALNEKAFRLNPVAPVTYFYTHATLSYFLTGRYEDAVRMCKEELSRWPNDVLAYGWLAMIYAALGRNKEAQETAQHLLDIDPNFSAKRYARLLPFKNPERNMEILNLLLKAGLPEHPPLPLPDKPSIAVLPFDNMSGDPEQEYFADGITEEIITALTKTPKLFVIARNSSFRYKGKSVWIPTVGKELGVRYVLEGSIRKSGDKVRVTAQLIEAPNNRHLWAERYDRDLKDIFAIQDDITKNIITEVQVNLTQGEQAALSAEGTRNLDAYLLYLQAWDHLSHFNKEDNAKARQLAEKAIALDPGYDKGYSVLAFVELIDVWVGASKSPKNSFLRCIELAKKSIAIKNSPLPHRVLATTYVLLRKHDAAIEEAKKAVEMAPNYAEAYLTLGHVYMLSDMGADAIPVLQKAIRLNPYPPSPYFHNLAWAYYLEGKYNEAISEGKKAIAVSPKDIIAHRALICAYLSVDRTEEARKQAAEVLKIDPNFSVERAAKISPLKNKAKQEKISEQYRKAGLK